LRQAEASGEGEPLRTLVFASILAASLALPAVARAQVYAGLAVGAGSAKVPAGSYAAGVRGMLRLYAGYEFTPHVAIEAMTFDLGSPGDKAAGSQSTIGAFGVAAVGTLPVERWRFTGRVGVMFMEGRADIAETRKTTQAMLALGAGYDVIPKLTLGLEIGASRVEFASPLDEKAGVGWVGLTATYRF
jgi:Outer membrane protein beta-barrel domain